MRQLLFILSFLLSLNSFALAADADRELQELRTGLENKINAYSDARGQVRQQRATIAELTRASKSIDTDVQTAKKNRDKLEEVDQENPGTVDEPLNRARGIYTREIKRKQDAVVQIRIANEKLEVFRSQETSVLSEVQQLRTRFDGRLRTLSDRRLQERVSALKATKQIEAEGTMACGEMSLSNCKKQARKKAETNAIEQGSAVMIEALTEIKNFKLTNEQIRSESKGELSDIQTISANWIGDEVWREKIRATVTPVVTDNAQRILRRDVQAEILDSIGGAPNYALLNDASVRTLSEDQEVEQERKEEARRQEEDRKEEARLAKEERDRLAQEKALKDRQEKDRLEKQAQIERERRAAQDRILKEQRDREAREREAAKRDTRVIPSF